MGPVNNMSKMFLFKREIYSISDRNVIGEYVVVRVSADKQNVLGTKVIPARSEQEAEKYIKQFPWEVFKDLPKDPLLN
jgi:hypothetical protein